MVLNFIIFFNPELLFLIYKTGRVFPLLLCCGGSSKSRVQDLQKAGTVGPVRQLLVRRVHETGVWGVGREAGKSGVGFWMREEWVRQSEKSHFHSGEDNMHVKSMWATHAPKMSLSSETGTEEGTILLAPVQWSKGMSADPGSWKH